MLNILNYFSISDLSVVLLISLTVNKNNCIFPFLAHPAAVLICQHPLLRGFCIKAYRLIFIFNEYKLRVTEFSCKYKWLLIQVWTADAKLLRCKQISFLVGHWFNYLCICNFSDNLVFFVYFTINWYKSREVLVTATILIFVSWLSFGCFKQVSLICVLNSKYKKQGS